jgi:hypothetical protein
MKVMQCIFCDQEACSDKVQWKDVIDPTSGNAVPVPGLMCVQSTTSAKGGESFGGGADEGADDDAEQVNDHMDADNGHRTWRLPA